MVDGGGISDVRVRKRYTWKVLTWHSNVDNQLDRELFTVTMNTEV